MGPTTTNTSAPSQRSPMAPFQQLSGSQFQQARNFDIHGGQFATELGSRVVTHLTINVPRMVSVQSVGDLKLIQF